MSHYSSLEDYHKDKKLRTGYTTGACATAAAKACVLMMLTQKVVDQVTIETPKGWPLTLTILNPTFSETTAQCYVVKDSGDDPDITSGMTVWVKVHMLAQTANGHEAVASSKIHIIGGKGVGKVTKPGLQVPVGDAAINPVPQQMIRHEIDKIWKRPQGLLVEISLPEGEVLAKKTFNSRLGIEGGLSILGTTGIVFPMSEEALKATIALELKVLRENGTQTVVLTPGQIGERLFKGEYPDTCHSVIVISNFIGFALETCLDLGFTQVFLVGHIGKLIKPAGGIFYTHSRISTTRMEILVAHLALMGMSGQALEKIMACRTTDEAIGLLRGSAYGQIYKRLAETAAKQCFLYCYELMDVQVAIFSMTEFLACSDAFVERLENKK